jgi:hypothetical protein
MSTLTPIEVLHATWCREASPTKEPLPVNLRTWERAYADFLEHGYTAEDLTLVLRHMKYLNRTRDQRFSLRQNLIFDFEYMRFDSLLQEAKATNRNKRPAPSEREKALEALRPTVDPETSTGTTAGAHVSALVKHHERAAN